MPKVVTSPVKFFSGTVSIKDPLPYVTVVKFEKAVTDLSVEDVGQRFLPVILESIEKWELQNLPPNPTLEGFPGTPRNHVYNLLAWLLGELTSIYKGNEDNDPNA